MNMNSSRSAESSLQQKLIPILVSKPFACQYCQSVHWAQILNRSRWSGISGCLFFSYFFALLRTFLTSSLISSSHLLAWLSLFLIHDWLSYNYIFWSESFELSASNTFLFQRSCWMFSTQLYGFLSPYCRILFCMELIVDMVLNGKKRNYGIGNSNSEFKFPGDQGCLNLGFCHIEFSIFCSFELRKLIRNKFSIIVQDTS